MGQLEGPLESAYSAVLDAEHFTAKPYLAQCDDPSLRPLIGDQFGAPATALDQGRIAAVAANNVRQGPSANRTIQSSSERLEPGGLNRQAGVDDAIAIGFIPRPVDGFGLRRSSAE
jgi:hypothetical protein